MKGFLRLATLTGVFASMSSFAANVPLQQLRVSVPDGWKLTQEGRTSDTLFATFAHGTEIAHFYVKGAAAVDMKSTFAAGSTIADERSERHGAFDWNTMHTTKRTFLDAEGRTAGFHVKSFSTSYRGDTYFGFVRTESDTRSNDVAAQFLDGVRAQLRADDSRSLTGPDYNGKKYYYGFGDKLSGSMGNEVKYDIKHTNDIFTKEVGGSYIGETKLNPGHSGITSHWHELGDKIQSDDMYVQYSSGHGSQSGLMVGVSYNEIRDNALSYKAKEIVIFTMSCFSGNLVKSFDQKKSVWGGWQDQGRTLYVMSSSQASEESSTGPGTDSDESGGPSGSAGSAFGHALWKSLIGYADGYVDGVKDGFISLEEIREYATARTKEIGGHTPAVTGAYAGNLVMNKVPSKEFLAQLENSTEKLTDAQIMERVQALDHELSIR